MTDDTKTQPHVLRPKGEPRFMPPDFTISLGAAGETDRQLLKTDHRPSPANAWF